MASRRAAEAAASSCFRSFVVSTATAPRFASAARAAARDTRHLLHRRSALGSPSPLVARKCNSDTPAAALMARCAVRSFCSDPSTKTNTAQDPAPSKTKTEEEEEEEDSREEHLRLQISEEAHPTHVGKAKGSAATAHGEASNGDNTAPKVTKGEPENVEEEHVRLQISEEAHPTHVGKAKGSVHGDSARNEDTSPPKVTDLAPEEDVQDDKAPDLAPEEDVEDDVRAVADGAPDAAKVEQEQIAQADPKGTVAKAAPEQVHGSQDPKAEATAPDGAHKGSNPQAEATGFKEDEVSQWLKAAATAFMAATAAFKAASIALNRVMSESDKSSSVRADKSAGDSRITPAGPRLPRRRGTRVSISQQLAAHRRFLVNQQEVLKQFLKGCSQSSVLDIQAALDSSHLRMRNLLICCFIATFAIGIPAFLVGVRYATNHVEKRVKDLADSDFTKEKFTEFIKQGKADLRFRSLFGRVIFRPEPSSDKKDQGKEEEKSHSSRNLFRSSTTYGVDKGGQKKDEKGEDKKEAKDQKNTPSLFGRLNPFAASPSSGVDKGGQKKDEKGEDKKEANDEKNTPSLFGRLNPFAASPSSGVDKGEQKKDEKGEDKKEAKDEKNTPSLFGRLNPFAASPSSGVEKGEQKKDEKEEEQKEAKDQKNSASLFGRLNPFAASPSSGLEKGLQKKDEKGEEQQEAKKGQQKKDEKEEEKKEKAEEKKEKAAEKNASWFRRLNPFSAPPSSGTDDNK